MKKAIKLRMDSAMDSHYDVFMVLSLLSFIDSPCHFHKNTIHSLSPTHIYMYILSEKMKGKMRKKD